MVKDNHKVLKAAGLLTDDGSNLQEFSSERRDLHTQEVPQAFRVYGWWVEEE